jgi:Uncharacterized protein involved in cysteine biosynthesis
MADSDPSPRVGLWAALSYPWQALTLLARTRRLWQYVLFPLLLNIVVGILLYIGLLYSGWQAIDRIVADWAAWGVVIAWFLRVLLIVLLLIGTGFILVRFGVTLGSPWYSKLSAELEGLRTGQPVIDQPFSWKIMLRDIGRAIGYELKKLLLLIGIGLPSLLLNLVPGFGQILATVVSIALGSLISCLDFFDGALERRLLKFRQKLKVIWKTLPASAGFGLICFLLVSIPIVNFFTIPICVAAGTLFVCDNALPMLGKAKE